MKYEGGDEVQQGKEKRKERRWWRRNTVEKTLKRTREKEWEDL